VRFDHCAFVQQAAEPAFVYAGERATSLAVEPAEAGLPEGRGAPEVRLVGCYFVTGQTAVAVHGPATVTSESCAFGPHGPLFRLRGEEALPSLLALHNCSAFVVWGPAFRLEGRGQWTVSAQECLFSCPDTVRWPSQANNARLLEQSSDRVKLVYLDRHTCYHGLNTLWAGLPRGKNIITDWDRFRKEKVARPSVPDDQSFRLPPGAGSPWAAADPLAVLKPADPAAAANQDAFRINPKVPELRQGKESPAALRPLGVQDCVFGTYEPLRPLSPAEPPAVARTGDKHERIVDPSAEGGTRAYQTLASALADARPGDVVLIKYTGTLWVDPVRLKPGSAVTIRPYEGYRPVLTLSTSDLHGALFQVVDAQLKLEHLELVLAPDATDFKSQTVAALVGGSECTFKDCVLTLRGLAGVPRQAVTVEGGDGRTMPTPAPRPVPRVSFKNCLVRGEGNVVRLPQSRSVEVQAENSAVALDGSFLSASGSAGEGAAVQGEARVQLDRLTAYLTGHLLALEDGKRAGKGLVKTQVSANSCLFASASGKSLVRVEGMDGLEQIKRVFGWSGGHNWYSGFEDLLDQPAAMLGTPLHIDVMGWGMNFRDNDEVGSHFSRLKFDVDPQREGALAKALPAQLRPRSDEATGFGAEEGLAEHLGLAPAPAGAAEESSSRDRRPGARDE
jgi:hypothetical protein